MKAFLMDEAARLGVSITAVHSNIVRGNYVGIRLERINPRLVFVVDAGKLVPKCEQLGRIGKYGLNHKEIGHTVYNRLWRLKTGRTKRPQLRYRADVPDGHND